jgi:hypothetical protein
MAVKKKEPSDYPSLSVRLVSYEAKEEIVSLIEQIYEKANRNSVQGKRLVKKNEIITEALLKGLKSMKRSK